MSKKNLSFPSLFRLGYFKNGSCCRNTKCKRMTGAQIYDITIKSKKRSLSFLVIKFKSFIILHEHRVFLMKLPIKKDKSVLVFRFFYKSTAEVPKLRVSGTSLKSFSAFPIIILLVSGNTIFLIPINLWRQREYNEAYYVCDGYFSFISDNQVFERLCWSLWCKDR